MHTSKVKLHKVLIKSFEGCHTWRTGTGVAVAFFLACPTVLAGEGQAESRDAAAVLTVRTRKPIRTLTEVGVHQIHTFCPCRGDRDPQLVLRLLFLFYFLFSFV